MPVSEEYLQFALDQLDSLGHVTAKRMFGGAGLYLGSVFFGIIADDVLYLKVDDSNRPDYEAAGMGPFRPFGGKSYAMQYYQVPVDVLEDRDALREWAQKAVAVAEGKGAMKKAGRSARNV
jgi:DNA transformation protein